MPRFHVPLALRCGDELTLPASAARHVQVLRLQPGDALTLFNGQANGDEHGQWQAEVLRMGRSDVVVRVGAFAPVQAELATPVTLAVGMPANDRMDWLVEKATELGVAAIQPLMCERSVLRLSGERAQKKVDHWQAVAVSAAEQCGRVCVPVLHPVLPLRGWLARRGEGLHLVLSPQAQGGFHQQVRGHVGALSLVSGPEGGLSPAEEALCRTAGCLPVSLGPRILRAETAPLAALAWLACESA